MRLKPRFFSVSSFPLLWFLVEFYQIIGCSNIFLPVFLNFYFMMTYPKEDRSDLFIIFPSGEWKGNPIPFIETWGMGQNCYPPILMSTQRFHLFSRSKLFYSLHQSCEHFQPRILMIMDWTFIFCNLLCNWFLKEHNVWQCCFKRECDLDLRFLTC